MGYISQHLLLVPVCLEAPSFALVEPAGKPDKIVTDLHKFIWSPVLIAGLLSLLILGDSTA